jgi:AraC-like DNA-binding protein
MRATPTSTGSGKTTLCSWVKAVCRALDAAGWDSAQLLAEAGFEANALDGPTARCALSSSLRLWSIAMAATGDPAFGLKVASHLKPTSFHALSFAISASSTLKEAFERAQRYSHIGSDAIDYEFQLCGSEYHFIIAPSADLGDEPIDALVASHVRMCRSLIGSDYSPLRIEFRRSRPARIDDFLKLLRAPLIFDAPKTRLVFDRDSIERPLESGNPELARHNDAIALKYLSQLKRENTEVRVREVLPQCLASGEPSQEDIAEILGMSARTLQRKLGEAGTTYKEILDDTRHALALAYLSTSRHSVSDVTYLLGFSAGSCFTRAFRRWTGCSPSDWRAARALQSTPTQSYLPSPRNLPSFDFGLPDLTLSL